MWNQNKLRRRLLSTWHAFRAAVILSVVGFIIGGASVSPGGLLPSVLSLTRPIEFDYADWTVGAITAKFSSWALSLNRFLTPQAQSQWVLDTLNQVQNVNTLTAEVMQVYADPEVVEAESASLSLRQQLQREQERLVSMAPLAESILQAQLVDILKEIDLDQLGQVLPPSLYQSSDVPYALIVSPRHEIFQALDVSITPGLATQEINRLEQRIFNDLDHAALVVPIGGVGTYPTMVMQTSNIVWLTEVVAHEWVHNYLTLRPLGINYFTNAELRTINETTASLAGKELGRLILQKYYPEFLPNEIASDPASSGTHAKEAKPDVFDFNKEMRITRVEVDRLLAQGEIETAEAYMEARRQDFWENGYLIRRLNQAYFAFYGAYSDEPGGAAGVDPVGPAVVAYRDQFTTLADFLKAISWVDSFEKLLDLIEV
jgi:hypothetical protein